MTLSLYALDPLADELRAALRWSRHRRQRPGRAAVWPAGSTSGGGSAGLAREGRLWLFRLYERIAETGERIPDAELAAAYHMHSLHAGADGEFAEELRYSQRAEAAARQAGDAGLLARVLAGRARAADRHGRSSTRPSGSAGRSSTGRTSRTWSATRCSPCSAWPSCSGGGAPWTRRRSCWARPARWRRPARWSGAGASVDMLLGLVALARGDLVAAHDHLLVALRSRMSHGFHARACETLNAMAVRCALGGDAADRGPAVRRGAGGPGEHALLARHLRRVLGASSRPRCAPALGDAAFDAAYGEGAELGLEEAAALALTVEHPDLAAGSTRFSAVSTGPPSSSAASPSTRTAAVTDTGHASDTAGSGPAVGDRRHRAGSGGADPGRGGGGQRRAALALGFGLHPGGAVDVGLLDGGDASRRC